MFEANVIRYERVDDVLVMTLNNPPVNAGSTAVRTGLMEGVARLASDATLRGGVIVGDHGTFISGSDLREFGGELPMPRVVELIRAIEQCPSSIVAAIDGYALGGGFEVTLACDHRVATPRATMGLPEVSLGMVPGGGGSQRLPRLVGRGETLELVTSSRRFKAPEALERGIVDEVVPVESLLETAIAAARSVPKRVLMDEAVVPDAATALAEVAARLTAAPHRPNIDEAIRLVGLAGIRDAVTSLVDERAVFDRLRLGDEAAALRHLFFAERAAARSRPDVSVGDRITTALRREAEHLRQEGVTSEQLAAAADELGLSPVTLGSPPTDPADIDSDAVDDIVRRLVVAVAVEATKLVDGGVVPRATDIDVAAARDVGFPRHLGGPLWWASRLADEHLAAAVREMSEGDAELVDRVTRLVTKVRHG